MIYEFIQSLSQTDQNLLLYLNGFHNSFFDSFMSLFTGKWIWVPMYASILYVLLKNFNWKIAVGCLVAIALTIVFADQMCASIIRPVVERLRPSNLDNPIAEFVHIVNGRRGGGYGFPSCHASNSFGLAFFLILLLRKRWLSIFIGTWAVINCYTRIYLGLHYPGDLLVGALIGCVGATIMYCLLRQATHQDFSKAQQTEVTIYTGLLTIVGILIYSTIQSF